MVVRFYAVASIALASLLVGGNGAALAGDDYSNPQSGDSYSPPEAGEQPAQPDDSAAPYMQKLRAGLETSDRRHRSSLPAYADRRLRPLALRRASTFRPPAVAIRARKPWRRLRTRRDG